MDIQINNILNNNILSDLKKLIHRREQLNRLNFFLIYIFHFIQCVGIFITMIATQYNILLYIWLGVGLNTMASLIMIYEKINMNISDKLYQDIIKIKNGSYIDNDIIEEGKL